MKEVIIRIMTLEDYPKVKSLLMDNFLTDEPTCMSSEENVLIYGGSDFDLYNRHHIQQNTSLIALQDEQVVGAVIAVPHTKESLEKFWKYAEGLPDNSWGRVNRIDVKLGKESKVFERFKVSRVLYSSMTCVDRSMRGKGIGNRLVKRLIELGRDLGYPLLMAYCTSYYSVRQKESLGWKCIYALNFADYKDEKERVIFAPPEPHKQAKVLVYEL